MLIRTRLLWLLFSCLCLVLPAHADPDASLGDMFIAIRNSDADAVGQMLRHGMDANVQDEQGYTALMMAAREGSPEVAGLLLKHGARVYLKNRFGETAVMLAAFNGHNAVIELLLAQGATLGANSKGWNPLLYAAFSGHAPTVRLLLAYGMPVDSQTDAGLTALMLAAKQGCLECISMLLRMGADPGLRSRQGESALDMALSVGNTDIGELLEQAARSRRK